MVTCVGEHNTLRILATNCNSLVKMHRVQTGLQDSGKNLVGPIWWAPSMVCAVWPEGGLQLRKGVFDDAVGALR